MKAGTVEVLYPSNGTVATDWHLSFQRMRAAYNGAGIRRITGEIHDQTGANITKARNLLVQRFLEGDAEWAFFWDTDMSCSPDALERLLQVADEVDAKIVGGLYVLVGQETIEPHLYQLVDGQFHRMKDYPENTVLEVAATGTGCLLIHRDVFEHMRRESDHDFCWFAEGVVSGQWLGEDISFCLRARALGYKVWVDTATQFGHIKGPRTYWPPDCRQKPRNVPTYAVIPTKGTRGYVKDLVRQLAEQVSATVVLDNGCKRETRNWLSTQKNVTVLDADGMGIHEMWNLGVRWALDHSAVCNVAILNDDLRLGDDAIPTCADALRADDRLIAVCPNYDGRPVDGVTYTADISVPQLIKSQNGGLAGFCMVVKSEWFGAGYAFPEECRWWYGDNDLVRSITMSGYACGIVTYATVEHLDDGQNTGQWFDPEMQPVLDADRKAFEERWQKILEAAA